MADADGAAEGNQEVESLDEDMGAEDSLIHLSKYCEARRALPWEQWTLREKAVYYMDRLFLWFLVIFAFIFLGEACYKMWYVTDVKKIAGFMSDTVTQLLGWLFTQVEHEEMIEL